MKAEVSGKAGRFLLAVLLTLFINTTVSTRAGDQVFGAFYRKEFMQVGDFVFTNMPVQVITWEGWARGFAESDLKSGTVRTPAGASESFNLDSQGALFTELSDGFPVGNYSFTFERADDSTFMVDLVQPAAAFPAPPIFLNLMQTEIKAGVDLRLSVQPGADAQPGDFLLLTVAALNTTTFTAWEFSTPWPGQLGALEGSATSVTVPGYLLKPNDSLQVRLVAYRPVYQQGSLNGLALAGSAAGVATSLMVADAPQDNDVALYRSLSSRILTQGADGSITPSSKEGFAFEASAWARSVGRLTNATVALSGGNSLQLEETETSTLWQANTAFDREDQLPVGNCTWSFDGVVKSRQTATTPLSGAGWPAPISVLNWATLQTNSFTNDVVVRWTAPADAVASDQIEFIVVNSAGYAQLRVPNYSEYEPPLSGLTTAVTIPAGVLGDGQDYEARLRHIRVSSQTFTALNGSTGIVARCSETRFAIGTRTAPPLGIVSDALPPGIVAESYSAQIQAKGGRQPWTWSVTQGQLPAGLSFSPAGALTGIPYENGAFHIFAQVTDALGNQATRELSLSVTGTLQPLSIATSNLPDVADGGFYLVFLQLAGGAPPYNWSIANGALPPGMKLHPPTGMLSGQGETPGVYPFEVRLVDGAGQVERRNLTLIVPSATNNPPLRVTEFWVSNSSVGRITAAPVETRKFKVSVNAQPDEMITLDNSGDLTTWQSVLTTNFTATTSFLEWPFPDAAAQFYRVRRGEAEPQYNPVSINVSLDTNTVATGLLTKAGLSLIVTNASGIIWRLDIPTNAVLQPTQISMTSLESANGFPFQVGFLGGVSFAPEGLNLRNPAALTGTFPTSLPPETSGFGFGEGGADFHLKPSEVSDRVITFPITHFSGAMGGTAGSGDKNKMIDDHTACSSQTSHEAQLAQLIDSGATDQQLWEYLRDWFYASISPKLKAAAGDDESLWTATSEALAWLNLVQKYGRAAATQNPYLVEDCWKMLARAFACAIDRSAARCVEQKRPFQAVRMMKLAQAARGLGLEEHLSSPYDATYFSEEKMLARYKSLFRFELEIESSDLSIKPKSGGSFIGRVHSEKCPIEAKDYDYADEENLQKLNVAQSKPLISEVWDLFDPENVVSGVVSEGSITTVHLYIWPNYAKEGTAGGCSKGLTYNDPTDPDIELVFDASDPVKQMRFETKYGPKFVPISSKPGSMNWWGLFRGFHAMQLLDEHDSTGQAHLSVPKIGGKGSDDWTYEASDPFATAEFHGPPKYADNLAGQAQEDTVLKLRHAPKGF